MQSPTKIKNSTYEYFWMFYVLLLINFSCIAYALAPKFRAVFQCIDRKLPSRNIVASKLLMLMKILAAS